MNMELLMQYITYVLLAIGGMAFLVAGITQAIKDMPKLCKIQTNVVAICVSLILCPVVRGRIFRISGSDQWMGTVGGDLEENKI